MQVKSDEVELRLLESAANNFLKFGFEKASLRTIASEAGATKGNIYNYFKDKDALFRAVVEPAVTMIETPMIAGNVEYESIYCRSVSRKNARDVEDVFLRHAKQVQAYSKEIELLLFRSSGSSHQGYRERVFSLWTARAIEAGKETIWKGKGVRFTLPLLHSMASIYLSFIEEIIVHKPKLKELRTYIHQLATYHYYGAMNVLRGR
jgi:AcrR family transcriptional regulator